MFRFSHHKYGPMELTSRDMGETGVHFTISYAGHPTHHTTHAKREEYYKLERLNEHLMEDRFDTSASLADSGDISFNGAKAFDQIEKQVECFVGTEWNEGNVLSVQIYDDTNHATFQYASIGMFLDDSLGSGLQDFEPQGMPLTGGQDCCVRSIWERLSWFRGTAAAVAVVNASLLRVMVSQEYPNYTPLITRRSNLLHS
ncbi:hypothetical protein BDW60DRAFT_10387 [Aspergillus nidulans var. acristatus]